METPAAAGPETPAANLLAGDLVASCAFQVAALASTVLDLLLVGLIIDYRIRPGRPTQDR